MAVTRVEEGAGLVRHPQPRENQWASQQPAERGAVAIAQEERVWRRWVTQLREKQVGITRMEEVRGRWGTEPREE